MSATRIPMEGFTVETSFGGEEKFQPLHDKDVSTKISKTFTIDKHFVLVNMLEPRFISGLKLTDYEIDKLEVWVLKDKPIVGSTCSYLFPSICVPTCIKYFRDFRRS